MKTTFMKRFLLSIISICAVINVFGQTETFDIATFTAPTGWQRLDSNGMILFHDYKTANGLNSFCQIFLYPSVNSSGNAEKDFTNTWAHLVARPTANNSKPTTEITKTDDGWTVVTGYANITFQDLTYTCMLVTASGFSKTISVQVNVIGQDYMAHVMNFLNAYELDSKKALAKTDPVINPVITQDKMNQVNQYPGSNNGVFYAGMQAATGGFEYANSKHFLYLSADNTFRWGYSQEGYYNYNSQVDKMKSPDFAGTYTKSGNNITLNFYSSRTMQFFQESNDNLNAGQYKFIRLPQLNGHTFEGTYIKADLIKELWPNGQQPRAMFHKNGRFEDQGLLGMGETVDVSLPYQEWKQRTAELGMWGNGSYTIVDNSLLLNYDDGRRKQLLIYIHDEDAKKTSPGLIVVAGLSFTQVK